MMRVAALTLALVACAPVAAEREITQMNMAEAVQEAEKAGASEPEIGEFGSGRICRAEGLSAFVGRPATAELATGARDRAGAARVRWLRPDAVVTMDYREDRLNIHLDARNRVTRLACG